MPIPPTGCKLPSGCRIVCDAVPSGCKAVNPCASTEFINGDYISPVSSPYWRRNRLSPYQRKPYSSYYPHDYPRNYNGGYNRDYPRQYPRGSPLGPRPPLGPRSPFRRQFSRLGNVVRRR